MSHRRWQPNISVSPLRQPNLRAMEDDSGKRDRYQQFCIFQFLVSRVFAAELFKPVHASLDPYYIALTFRFVSHTYERTSPQSCVDKVVSVPVSCGRTGGPTFRVFVNQLNADNLVGYVGHQVQAVKMSFEVTVVSDVIHRVPRKAWSCQFHP